MPRKSAQEVTEEIRDVAVEAEDDGILRDEDPVEAAEAVVEAAEQEAQEEAVPEAEGEDEPAPAPRARRASRRGKGALGADVEIPDDERLTRREARALYTGDRIYADDMNERPLTEEEKLRQTALALSASKANGNVLYGTLEAVTTSADEEGVVFGIVDYNGFQVKIPAAHLFIPDRRYRTNDSRYSADVNYVERRLGAKHGFVVVQLQEKEKVAYASHLYAVEKQIREQYFDTDQRGRHNVRVGRLVEGIITYITKDGMGVEFQGAETFIPNKDVDWKYVDDCRILNYNVGDKVVALIKEIEPFDYQMSNGQVLHLVRVTASIKETTEDPDVKYFDEFHVGDRHLGEVTGRGTSGYYVRLHGRRDVLCLDDREETIPVGTKVRVKIINKNEELHRIYGRIHGIVKLPY